MLKFSFRGNHQSKQSPFQVTRHNVDKTSMPAPPLFKTYTIRPLTIGTDHAMMTQPTEHSSFPYLVLWLCLDQTPSINTQIHHAY